MSIQMTSNSGPFETQWENASCAFPRMCFAHSVMFTPSGIYDTSIVVVLTDRASVPIWTAGSSESPECPTGLAFIFKCVVIFTVGALVRLLE